MQSGNPIFYGSETGTQATQPVFDTVVNATNCTNSLDKVQCLREVPFDEMNAVFNSSATTTWRPTVDGDFVRNYGSIQLEKGEFVKVPIIDGANSDEGSAFGVRGINTTDDFIKLSLSGGSSGVPRKFPSLFGLHRTGARSTSNINQLFLHLWCNNLLKLIQTTHLSTL
jgi:hypothetical protein